MTQYQQAKSIYNDLQKSSEETLHCDDIKKFRTHLSEFEYRKKEGKKFITKILSKNMLFIKRIE